MSRPPAAHLRRALAACLAAAAPLAAQDVLHLKDGTTVRCRIVAITDNILTYETSLDLGGGRRASARPTIPTPTVAYIEFAPLPGEAELMASPATADPGALGRLWDEASKHLHRPRSDAGRLGLAYAERLLSLPEAFRREFALAIYDRLLERDWNPANRQAARKGRLRALIRLGQLDRAADEARRLAAETDDPEMLIEARHALAEADFAALKALEADHPRWQEDDEVRPERERLYHAAVDGFLWPFLFHGTLEPLAARGLAAAAEVHRFAGNPEEAAACLGDLAALYPGSPAAAPVTAPAGPAPPIPSLSPSPSPP